MRKDTVNSRSSNLTNQKTWHGRFLTTIFRALRDASQSVEAVVLVGSLATGSYVPARDIDQITIVRDETAAEVVGQLSRPSKTR